MKYSFLEVKPKHVERLWDFASSWAPYQNSYFSAQVSEGLVAMLKLVNVLDGKVLDYGCGTGELMGRLLHSGVRASGVDFSPESIQTVRDLYGDHPLFAGAEVVTDADPQERNSEYDLVISIETIEHLFPDEIVPTFRRISRMIKPGGYVFVTTPYNEDLREGMCFCPNCATLFHKWLHLSSFDVPKLSSIMESAGFETLLCDHTDFRNFQFRRGKRHVLRQRLRNPALTLLDLLSRRSALESHRLKADLGRGGNLFYLGRVHSKS